MTPEHAKFHNQDYRNELADALDQLTSKDRINSSLLRLAAKALRSTVPEERAHALLKDLGVALDDWVHTYAPEFCGAEYVHASDRRIYDGGGTLAYIAALRQRVAEATGERIPTWGESTQPQHVLKEKP